MRSRWQFGKIGEFQWWETLPYCISSGMLPWAATASQGLQVDTSFMSRRCQVYVKGLSSLCSSLPSHPNIMITIASTMKGQSNIVRRTQNKNCTMLQGRSKHTPGRKAAVPQRNTRIRAVHNDRIKSNITR